MRMRLLIAMLALLSLVLVGCGKGKVTPPAGQDDKTNIRVTTPAPGTEISGDVIHVEGQARVFEATFMIEIEDGHNVLVQEMVMTDEGAPAWGNFSADLKLGELPTNRNLTVIFFVYSAEDGSRQEMLHIPLKYTGPCANNAC